MSGRGVGMDVVRNNIDQIGGTIDVKSVAGVGLSFTIKIPLTLAIVAALDRGGRRRPLRHPADFRGRAGARARRQRSPHRAHQGHHGAAPARQAVAAGAPESTCSAAKPDAGRRSRAASSSSPRSAARASASSSMRVFHTEEIVVKPMSSKLRHIAMFSGNTILGDGAVIMIIDPNGIAQALGSTVTCADGRCRKPADTKRRRAAAEQTTSLLVFRAGSRAAQGGAAVADHAAGGNRRPQDRTVERPPHGAVPRPVDAADRP